MKNYLHTTLKEPFHHKNGIAVNYYDSNNTYLCSGILGSSHSLSKRHLTETDIIIAKNSSRIYGVPMDLIYDKVMNKIVVLPSDTNANIGGFYTAASRVPENVSKIVSQE